MYEVVLLNVKNQKFIKNFNSEYLMRKFINKAKYSKSIKVLSFGKIY